VVMEDTAVFVAGAGVEDDKGCFGGAEVVVEGGAGFDAVGVVEGFCVGLLVTFAGMGSDFTG